MKAAALMLLCLLSGCGPDHSTRQQLFDACKSKGGTILIVQGDGSWECVNAPVIDSGRTWP